MVELSCCWTTVSIGYQSFTTVLCRTYPNITIVYHSNHTLKKAKDYQKSDRRQNLVPDFSGTKSIWHTVQKSAPIFGADFQCRNLDCESWA